MKNAMITTVTLVLKINIPWAHSNFTATRKWCLGLTMYSPSNVYHRCRTVTTAGSMLLARRVVVCKRNNFAYNAQIKSQRENGSGLVMSPTCPK